jgi:hypothetical protein
MKKYLATYEETKFFQTILYAENMDEAYKLAMLLPDDAFDFVGKTTYDDGLTNIKELKT